MEHESQKPRGLGVLRAMQKKAAICALFLALAPLPALAVDAPGVATAPARVGQEASDWFFQPDTIQEIQLEITADNLKKMRDALPQRITVPGKFHWRDQTVNEVGVRYKGNSSSMPNAKHKRSFLISFPEYQKGQRFLGLRHVALDNGVQFGSLFSEPLITEILRAEGVKASRCNYASLSINGEYMGLYVNVERMDDSFLERAFGNSDGELFKVDEGGQGADLGWLGPDPKAYNKTFELHAGKKREAYPHLVDFVRKANDLSMPESDLRKTLDVDAFIKTTAILLFSGAFDQYTGWQPHNYYLCRDPAAGSWTYLPWDLDVGFADLAFGKIPVLEGWNAAWPAPLPGRPLLEQILSREHLLEQYRAEAGRILEKYFKPEILIPKLQALYQLAKPALKNDPFPARRVVVASDRNYDDVIASIEQFIQRRYELARQQLNNPGARPAPAQMHPPGNDGPAPGPVSPDAPADLSLVKAAPGKVQLKWKDHARGEVAFVVQRAEGTASQTFQNFIGQGGENIETAVDDHAEPGKTYRYRVYAVLPTEQGPRGTGLSNVITVNVPEK
jgi:hypothetical protein